MIVNSYADHIAYTFENNDSMFMLGMKLVNKSENDIISAVDVIYNNQVRLLFGVEKYKPLYEVASSISDSELAKALIKFVESISQIKNNDFLKISAVDINYNRLFYDAKNNVIKYIVLPINYECDFHDGESWSSTFRKTLLLILNIVFKNSPRKYEETYYAILDNTKSDEEILDYIAAYDFSMYTVDNSYKAVEQPAKKLAGLRLEHNSDKGNLVFVINKPEFILGKSNSADGFITNSTNVSRHHCKIVVSGDSYMISDLNSTNGTRVNGYYLTPNDFYYLNNGDKLSVADIEFTIVLG